MFILQRKYSRQCGHHTVLIFYDFISHSGFVALCAEAGWLWDKFDKILYVFDFCCERNKAVPITDVNRNG